MYNTYLYAVANEGVDSEDTYPYKGKVNNLNWHNYCTQVIRSNISVSSSNTHALSAGTMLEPRCLALCLLNKAVSLTCWLPWPAWDLCQWLWMEGIRLSGCVLLRAEMFLFFRKMTPPILFFVSSSLCLSICLPLLLLLCFPLCFSRRLSHTYSLYLLHIFFISTILMACMTLHGAPVATSNMPWC